MAETVKRPPFRYYGREASNRIMTESLPRPGRGLSLERIRELYSPPDTLGMPEDVKLAQDSALDTGGYYGLLYHTFQTIRSTAYPQFLGYGILSGLMQNQCIRAGVEMLANEMTREWIELNRVGEPKKKEKEEEEEDEPDFEAMMRGQIDDLDEEEEHTEDKTLQRLEHELYRFDVQGLFRRAFALTGYMGGCLIYIDTLGDDASPEELLAPLYLDSGVFPAGSLRGFRLIEPFNVSPGMYQCTNPLRSDYFQPQTWWVSGREIHRSRLLYFAHNLPSTLLLPAYNFFGMPIAQLVLDAVTHFTSTRESTMRALKKYSLTVFKTPINEMIGQPDFLSDIQRRVQFMCDYRDNDGIEIIDSESESIESVVSPISGMTEIVRQAMDIVAAMFGEPTVKLWGITPSGLNSTGEADLTNHYDNIASMQEAVFKTPLRQILRVLQWNKFGRVDSTIDFTFKPLGVMNEQTLSQIQASGAQRDTSYISAGVLSPEEVRQRLADDPESGYSNIDVSAVPEPQGGQGPGGEGGMPDMSALMGGGGGDEPEMPGGEESEMPGGEEEAEESEDDLNRPRARAKMEANDTRGGRYKWI